MSSSTTSTSGMYQLLIATIIIKAFTRGYGWFFGGKTMKQRLKGGYFSRLFVASTALPAALLLSLAAVLLIATGVSYAEMQPILNQLYYLWGMGIIASVFVVGMTIKYLVLFILTQFWEDGLKDGIGSTIGLDWG